VTLDNQSSQATSHAGPANHFIWGVVLPNRLPGGILPQPLVRGHEGCIVRIIVRIVDQLVSKFMWGVATQKCGPQDAANPPRRVEDSAMGRIVAWTPMPI